MMPTGDDANVGVEGDAIDMLYPLFVSLSFFSSFFLSGLWVMEDVGLVWPRRGIPT